MICLGVGLFASILFGTLSASWTYMSIFFTKLGKFFSLFFSNRFPISCSFSSPSGTPMMQMLHLLKLSEAAHIILIFLNSFLFLLFLLVVYCFLRFQIIYLILSFITLLLFPCKMLFQLVKPSFLIASF